MKQAGLALSRAEWACLAFALVAAHAFLVHEWFYPSAWDATQYVDIARDIADRGMFRQFTGAHVRTYGYPLVLSLVLRAADETGLSFLVLLFAFQFLAYVAAAFFLRRSLGSVRPAAARIAFCGLLVNFYVLIYAAQSLSESLSITLLVFAAGAWAMLWNKGFALSPLVAGSLVVGFALMVRPANLFMIAAWVVGVAIAYVRHRLPALRALFLSTIMIAGIALPVAPQIVNNAVHFGKASPLVTSDIGLLQQTFGVQNLKYATAMPPVPHPGVFYSNPMYPGTTLNDASPWTWYVTYPLRGAATLALHAFNMTDQDLLFTYSRDLDPWYRLPLGIVNHAVVALGLVGLALMARDALEATQPRTREAFVVLFVLLVANLVVYAWTAVEMRFGSVLLLVLFPLAGYAAMRLGAVKSFGVRGGALCGIAAYVVLAMLLSGWVREQSPQIREYRVSRTELPPMRTEGDACCAPATDSAVRQGVSGRPHSHHTGFAG